MATLRELKWFRRLLILFPGEFRRTHQRNLEQAFVDMQAEWRRRGKRPGGRFWLGLVGDGVSGAIGEWATLLGRLIRRIAFHPGDVMSALLSSFRQAARQLLRQPSYSGLVILLAALGIAGNAAMFRVFDGLFLRALPFDEPHQLVDLDVTAPQWNLEFVHVSITDFNDWREESRSFQNMTAYTIGGGNLVMPERAIRVTALAATHEIDDVLRLVPTLGRFFTEAEDQPNAAPVAMLSEGFWQQEFGGNPGIVGQTIQSGGETREVVGVLPPEARLLGEADIWVPLREDDESSFYLRAIGRLQPGASVEQAREELRGIHARHVPDRDVNEVTSPTVMLLRDRYLGSQRLGGGLLFGAVAVVLLIACGNIAGLMLVRSVARTNELTVRSALGASRGRLVQQLMTESLLLATLGGALGVGLGIWGSSAIVTSLASQFPPFIAFDLDLRFLAFVVAVTVGAAVVAGLGPALRVSGSSVGAVTMTRTTSSKGMQRAMSTLVTVEVALATVLLVVSAIAVADIRAIGQTDPGFRTDVLTFRVSPDSGTYPESADQLEFWQRYRARLEALPGVENVAVSTIMPLMGHSGWFFDVDGSPMDAEDNAVVLRRWVEPGYFAALDVRLKEGRGFDDFDGRQDDAFVAVVNESFVRSHLSPDRSPIGQRIRTANNAPWETIVGVVADTRHYGLDQDSRPAVYEPRRQNPGLFAHVALVSSMDATTLAGAARGATRDVDADLPIYDPLTLAARLDRGLMTRRASSWVFAIFATVALILAIAGLYGVISYGVGQRSREIGIRMALGAQRSTVQRQVIRQGLAIVALGLAIGVAGAAGVTRLISSMLVAAGDNNLQAFAGVVGLVLTVALLANWAPARRAARFDPMTLLRRD